MNTALHFPLAVLPDHPALSETISFQINGLIVVFLVLGSIWVMLEGMGKIFARRQPAPSAVTRSHAVAAAETTGPSPATLAVITAAVHLTVGPGHRIVALAPVTTNPHWAMEGRRQIFASHRTR